MTRTPLDPGAITALFQAGQLDAVCAAVQAAQPVAVDAQLGSVILATGALGALPRTVLTDWLAVIPATLRPDLRYRALIRCGLWTEAARLRHVAPNAGDPAFQTACRAAASLVLLAAHRPGLGLRFYPHRMAGGGRYNRHVTQVFDYRPLDHTAADTIFLEQGVGDRFLHLAHIKAQRPATGLRFAVVDRWKPVLNWLFPGDEVIAIPTTAATPRPLANASGDYLARAFRTTGSFAPTARLGPALRRGPARFGLVWRGGSHQNQQGERQVGLATLLAMMPEGAELVALQPHLTQDERALILATPGLHLPAFDVTTDLISYAQLIAGLAGVIGVDNTAVHVAGVFGVPSYTVMNRSAHWYWGSDHSTATLYPQGRTVSANAFATDDLQRWMAKACEPYQTRPAPALLSGKTRFQSPLLVTGVPRSGTSLTMGMLHRCGLWTGHTVPGGPSNPDGFFENIAIRQSIVKPLLRQELGCDPLGVDPLPPVAPRFLQPNLTRRVFDSLQAEGYRNDRPWGYKGAKMALIWNIWAEAFPKATWIVVSRRPEAVVASCLTTHFMRQHSDDPSFWCHFHEAYTHRLEDLKRALPGMVISLAYEDLLAGKTEGLQEACSRVGLDWSEDRAMSLIRR